MACHIRTVGNTEVDFHPDFAGRFSTSLCPENGIFKNDLLELRILVDSCSIEVFAQNGAVYGAALIFPTHRETLEILSHGAPIKRGRLFGLL